MRAVFIGCVESSWRLLEVLLASDSIDVCGVVTRSASKFNTDFCSLEPLAAQASIPVFIDDGNNQQAMADWITALSPDVGFCIGWSYLLQPQVFQIPPHGTIGYHPALLPKNRGRHPIIWALALGLQETGSSFFMIESDADSGDIISQRKIPIAYDDDARSLYNRIVIQAMEQLSEITVLLSNRALARQPQDHLTATSWRKRNQDDGCIDWRMPAEGIRNLIRALASPYVGAHCIFQSREIKIWKAEVVPATQDIEPGRVTSINSDALTVKAGIDALRLLEHEFDHLPGKASYIR